MIPFVEAEGDAKLIQGDGRQKPGCFREVGHFLERSMMNSWVLAVLCLLI